MTDYSEWTDQQDSATVTVDDHDLEIAYYEDGSEGDPVVFLHGIPTNSYLFREVIDPIAEERRVIAPDMVGYGNSAQRDGFDRSIRAQEIAVRGLLDDLGIDQFSFVGHDLGGGVGLRLAARTPDRVDELQGMLDDLFCDTLYGDADEAFVEGMKAPWASEEGVTSVVRAASGTNTSHTTEVGPSDVAADTLLLWGAEDEFQAIEWAERLEDDIDSAELVGLDEANHWVMADRPDAYADHLADFLVGN